MEADKTVDCILKYIIPFNYMQSLNRHLDRYGRPLAIYSDRHSIFSNNAKKQREAQQPSQFARALGDLGI